MSLKVIALGTGVCANNCVPGPRRYPPGFLLDWNNQLLLLDASEGIRFRIEDAGYDFGLVGHIAITHLHPDHCALPQFLQSKLCRVLWGEQIPGIEKATVYMHDLCIGGFEQVWNWHHPEAGGKLNHFPDRFNFYLEPICDGWEKEIFPGLKLKSFKVYHGFGQHPALGFRVETGEGSIVYTGDAGMADSLFEQAEHAKLLICDSSSRLSQEQIGGYGHMSAKQAGTLAFHSQVKELWLTHYSGFDEPAAMEAAVREAGYNGTLKIATDGLTWQTS